SHGRDGLGHGRRDGEVLEGRGIDSVVGLSSRLDRAEGRWRRYRVGWTAWKGICPSFDPSAVPLIHGPHLRVAQLSPPLSLALPLICHATRHLPVRVPKEAGDSRLICHSNSEESLGSYPLRRGTQLCAPLERANGAITRSA